MKVILQDNATYILSIKKDEEVLKELHTFCEQHGIFAGHVSFIGAVNELELWWYNPATKEYQKKVFKEQLEITSAMGNISVMHHSGQEDEIVVHAHGVFGNEQYQAYTGHIHRAVVSGACEVYLEQLEGRMERAYDETIGLNILCAGNEEKEA